VLNATFGNISAISWRPVLVVEEDGVPGKNHPPWASKFLNKSTLKLPFTPQLCSLYTNIIPVYVKIK
jgi:hypothetical protein